MPVNLKRMTRDFGAFLRKETEAATYRVHRLCRLLGTFVSYSSPFPPRRAIRNLRPLVPFPLSALPRQRVDLLFNVAGVLGDGKSTPGPERSLRAMNREWLRHTLEINTIGPMMLVAALTPLLESPAKKGDQGARPPSVVVNFSARVGSIGDNGMGGWHSYRMSKVGCRFL